MSLAAAFPEIIPFEKHSTEDGSYWSSGLSKRDLRSMCLSFSEKIAESAGGDQETGFEQSFASLAFSYIRDRAPKLLPYAVGFQLIDRSEDNDKAAGVFGFKMGKTWLYVPVFFINGDLKGHELLYVKNQDVFVPLKENWINYVMSRRPRLLGEGSARDAYQLGGLSPNIERLASPPSMGKFGATIDSWARDYIPMLAACRTKMSRFIWRDRPAGEQFDLKKVASAPMQAALMAMPDFETFLKSADWKYSALALKWSDQYPGFKRACDRFYGKDFLLRMAEYHKKAADTAATLVTAMPKQKWQAGKSAFAAPAPIGSLLPPPEKQAAGDKKVRILTSTNVAIQHNGPSWTEMEDLAEGDKTHVLTHGYLVKDERKGEEVTQVYNTQIEQTLSNPSETGVYQLLERPGSFAKMLVISAPQSNSGASEFSTVVRLGGDGPKAWMNAHNSLLFVDAAREVGTRESFQKWYESLPKKQTLKKNKFYVGISELGVGTVPFKVKEHYDNKNYEAYRVDFAKHAHMSRGRPGFLPITWKTQGNPFKFKELEKNFSYENGRDALMVLNPNNGSKLKASAGDLHVPARSFRFIELQEPKEPKKPEEISILDKDTAEVDCRDCGSDPRPIDPGSIVDIQLYLNSKTAELSMLGDHGEVFIQSKAGESRMGWNDAVLHLVSVHGTDVDTARGMVHEARNKIAGDRTTFRVKYADQYPGMQDPGSMSPGFPMPNYGTEQIGYNSVNSIYPQEQRTQIPGMDSSRTDPRIYDPFLNTTPDSATMGAAQEAGQSGQKEVFDTSAIMGMLKTTHPSTVVDEHLGDFVKALDGVGRILFTLYYHNDDFVAQYSKSEVGDLEDSLRNTFEAVGDLVIFLRERKVESDIEGQTGLDHLAN